MDKIKMDKVLHFVVSMLIACTLTLIAKAFDGDTPGIMCGLYASVVTMAIGIAKEIKDKFSGGVFDWWDIVADALGCIPAIVFSIFA